ncbi:hypothetical protein MMC10_002168 [Thelotrema lepadinum]|nr:hypothetical protein [Thelotrema lepadinum]
MEDFCKAVLEELEISIDNDPLLRCGEEPLIQMRRDPGAAQQLADDKLHVFPFKDVDICWRRLYTDAGIRKALKLMLEHTRSGGDTWLDDVVKQLDMILIMTGAPLREEMVETVFARLEEYTEDRRQHRTDRFETSDYRAPEIQFAVPRSQMSLSQFEKLLEAPRPHVIEKSIRHWPAFEDRPWRSPSYLLQRTLGGSRLVPVELGRSYTDEGWGQTILPFRDFLEQYVLEGSKIGYLAQHNLFAQVPALRKDIAIPDFCYTSPPGPAEGTPLYGKDTKLDEPLLNAWFGPAGTISPLHTDPYHNVLCQVVGKKYVRLYAPEQTERLYPRGVEGGIDMSNTSQVPVEKVEMNFEDDGEYPLFSEAPYVETILEEGDCLYIPVGWWHYVRALTVSFNVSFWWN